MLTNEIKKGMRIKLRNGWFGTMFDNKRGNTRLVDVEGTYREIGSVYSFDIMQVEVDGIWQRVQHTPVQTDLRHKLNAMGI